MERPTRKALRSWVVVVALVVVALIVAPRLLRSPDLRQRLADAHHGIESGELILQMETTDAGLLVDFLAGRGVDVPLRTIGEEHAELALRGGRVHELAGGRAAALAYSGPGATVVVHWIVPDWIAARLSGEDAERPATGFFHEGGLTMLVWHEAAAVHVLSAKLSRETLAGFAGSTASLALCLNGFRQSQVVCDVDLLPRVT